MAARLFVEQPLGALALEAELALPPGAARHVQVLRLQPGDELTLFDGGGDEWIAAVTAMGRSEVDPGLPFLGAALGARGGVKCLLHAAVPPRSECQV